jgi:hypothetical protein
MKYDYQDLLKKEIQMDLESEPIKARATICVPNYKTLDFTKICLRSIRKFTNYPHDVIVVDNDSADESLNYLKSLPWIRLIDRKFVDGELTGSEAVGSAYDMALKECNTEFFVTMHTDTFVRRQNWLTELIKYFGDTDDITCVGSGKIELKPQWQIVLKKATDVAMLKRKIMRDPALKGKFRYHNRTICCVYRTAVLKQNNLSFMPDHERALTAGRGLYFDLVDNGHKTVELPSAVMAKYAIHLDHATQAINPNEFALRKKTVRKCNRIIEKIMSSQITQDILSDNSLDR